MKEVKMRGGIKSQGKGSWVIVLSLGRDPVTGKYRQKWITVKGTRKEAEAKRGELVSQQSHGELIEPSKMLLSDFLLNKWLPNHAKDKPLAPRTVDGYRQQLQTHILPALGHVRLGELKPMSIQGYYRRAVENGRRDGKGGLSGRSVRQHHAILHRALKDAVRWEMLSRNPCDAVTVPGFDSPTPRIFEETADLWRFLDVVKGEYPEHYCLFCTLLFTGLRRNEALGLTWGDLNFRTGFLTVKRTQHRRLKTKASERTIEVPKTAMLVLREHRETLEAVFQDMGITLSDDDYVFCRLEKRGGNGRPSPLLPDSVTHAWIKAVRKAGFDGMRLHDARHTNISQVIAVTKDLGYGSYHAGHASIRTTKDVYGHILDKQRHEAAELFDKAMSRPRQETPAEEILR